VVLRGFTFDACIARLGVKDPSVDSDKTDSDKTAVIITDLDQLLYWILGATRIPVLRLTLSAITWKCSSAFGAVPPAVHAIAENIERSVSVAY
jgi:hypothetical protein